MRHLICISLVCAGFVTQCEPASSSGDWSRYVRIAGHGLRPGTIPATIAESTGSHVFGIEVDNDIPGRYESFLDPAAKLETSASRGRRARRRK